MVELRFLALAAEPAVYVFSLLLWWLWLPWLGMSSIHFDRDRERRVRGEGKVGCGPFLLWDQG